MNLFKIVWFVIKNCLKKCWLVKKYREIKDDYLNRSPKGKWLFVRNSGIFILEICGLPVIDPNFQVNWRSYYSGVLYFDIFSSLFYTFWYYSDSPIKCILALPIFAIIIPVSTYQISYFMEIIP